jgi:alpha-ribazole phosphatase
MSETAGDVILTRWWWVRHAPVPDGGRIYGQGDLDCDCSETPVFTAVAQLLPKGAHWLTSDLKRTYQTANAIIAASNGRHGPPDMPRHPAFNEQHLGDWQGQDRGTTRRALGITPLDGWLTRGDAKAPNGESFPDLVGRVVPEIEAETKRRPGRDIVAVTHGGTIRAAIHHALGLSGETVHGFVTDNCAVTVLEHMQGSGGRTAWRVHGVNIRPWL